MQYDLIGYAIGALDGNEARHVEQLLAADSADQQRLERIRQELLKWRCSCSDVEPPDGLAARTCQCVVRRVRTQSPPMQ